jgi:hypothetical protein
VCSLSFPFVAMYRHTPSFFFLNLSSQAESNLARYDRALLNHLPFDPPNSAIALKSDSIPANAPGCLSHLNNQVDEELGVIQLRLEDLVLLM